MSQGVLFGDEPEPPEFRVTTPQEMEANLTRSALADGVELSGDPMVRWKQITALPSERRREKARRESELNCATRPAIGILAAAGIGATVTETVKRHTRIRVAVPIGREATGALPGTAGVTLTEHALRDRLAQQVKGVTEAHLG